MTTRDVGALAALQQTRDMEAFRKGDRKVAERKLWFVWGGVFTDSSWQELEPGTEQCFGPFHDAKSAERTWREEMQRRVDTAQHRLFVVEAPRPGGGA